MTKVKTEEELAKAIKNQANLIEIEGNLAEKTIKIRAVGSVAWAVALGAISIAVYSTIATIGSGGTATPATAPAGFAAASATAVALGGISVTTTAIAIAVSFGGVAALSTIRDDYKEVSRSTNKLVLELKK